MDETEISLEYNEVLSSVTLRRIYSKNTRCHELRVLFLSGIKYSFAESARRQSRQPQPFLRVCSVLECCKRVGQRTSVVS